MSEAPEVAYSWDPVTLLNDSPLGEGTSDASDQLGFSDYAEVIASAVVHTQGPFTIGVFGDWGTGKTSLMHLVERLLARDPVVATVWFNAWRYEREDNPLVPLIAKIGTDIASRKDFMAKFQDGGKSFLNALSGVIQGLSVKAKLKVPWTGELEVGWAADKAIGREESLGQSALTEKSVYVQAFEKLDDAALPAPLKIVVFIDDLDRCLPEFAMNLLESIKLVLGQRGFFFVLGVANRVLDGYVRHQYEVKYGLVEFRGSDYLEKLIQLPFYIPPHQPRYGTLYAALLEQVDRSVRPELSEAKSVLREVTGGNPRSTIRMINSLIVDFSIYQRLRVREHLPKDIPLSIFVVTRCLQLRWPTVLDALDASPELCRQILEWSEKPSDGISFLRSGQQSIPWSILRSDSSLRAVLKSDFAQRWLRSDELRMAARHFIETTSSAFLPPEPREDFPDGVLLFQVADEAEAREFAEKAPDVRWHMLPFEDGWKTSADIELELASAPACVVLASTHDMPEPMASLILKRKFAYVVVLQSPGPLHTIRQYVSGDALIYIDNVQRSLFDGIKKLSLEQKRARRIQSS